MANASVACKSFVVLETYQGSVSSADHIEPQAERFFGYLNQCFTSWNDGTGFGVQLVFGAAPSVGDEWGKELRGEIGRKVSGFRMHAEHHSLLRCSPLIDLSFTDLPAAAPTATPGRRVGRGTDTFDRRTADGA